LVGPKSSLDGCGNSRPYKARFPIRPACSEFLHQLSYCGPNKQILIYAKLKTEIEVRNRAKPFKEAKLHIGLKYRFRREKKKRKKVKNGTKTEAVRNYDMGKTQCSELSRG
jgi:hypothetical protein